MEEAGKVKHAGTTDPSPSWSALQCQNQIGSNKGLKRVHQIKMNSNNGNIYNRSLHHICYIYIYKYCILILCHILSKQMWLFKNKRIKVYKNACFSTVRKSRSVNPTVLCFRTAWYKVETIDFGCFLFGNPQSVERRDKFTMGKDTTYKLQSCSPISFGEIIPERWCLMSL